MVTKVPLFGIRRTRPVDSRRTRASRTVVWLTLWRRATSISRMASPGWRPAWAAGLAAMTRDKIEELAKELTERSDPRQ